MASSNQTHNPILLEPDPSKYRRSSSRQPLPLPPPGDISLPPPQPSQIPSFVHELFELCHVASSGLEMYFWLMPLIASAEQMAITATNEEERVDHEADRIQFYNNIGSMAIMLCNVQWHLVRTLGRIKNENFTPRYGLVPSYRGLIAYAGRLKTLLLSVNEHYTMSQGLGERGLATDPFLSSKLDDIRTEMRSHGPLWRSCIDDLRNMLQNLGRTR